jgi:hypothetical protein
LTQCIEHLAACRRMVPHIEVEIFRETLLVLLPPSNRVPGSPECRIEGFGLALIAILTRRSSRQGMFFRFRLFDHSEHRPEFCSSAIRTGSSCRRA